MRHGIEFGNLLQIGHIPHLFAGDTPFLVGFTPCLVPGDSSTIPSPHMFDVGPFWSGCNSIVMWVTFVTNILLINRLRR
jgi:hypothetical protein